MDYKEHRKVQQQISQVSALVSVGREKDLFAFTCNNFLEDTKRTKRKNTTTPDR